MWLVRLRKLGSGLRGYPVFAQNHSIRAALVKASWHSQSAPALPFRVRNKPRKPPSPMLFNVPEDFRRRWPMWAVPSSVTIPTCQTRLEERGRGEGKRKTPQRKRVGNPLSHCCPLSQQSCLLLQLS